MNNKQLGFIIVGFSAILGTIIYFFNRALTQIVSQSCDHGATCPMWGSLSFHTNLTVALTIIILAIGLYFIFFGEKHDKITKEIKKQIKKMTIPQELNPDEKQVMQIIINEEGTIFQSTLVEKTNHSKVKITRILDKLEGKNIIERKRRGMTNVVILKHTN
jgi:uncharacterized membrane protein